MNMGKSVLVITLLLIFPYLLNGAQSQSTGSVSIRNFSFQPETLTVPPGTTVIWTNYELPLAGERYTTEHTVTGDNGTFNSGPIGSGDQFRYLFNRSGDYPYHDEFFPYMHGAIVVTSNSPIGDE